MVVYYAVCRQLESVTRPRAETQGDATREDLYRHSTQGVLRDHFTKIKSS